MNNPRLLHSNHTYIHRNHSNTYIHTCISLQKPMACSCCMGQAPCWAACLLVRRFDSSCSSGGPLSEEPGRQEEEDADNIGQEVLNKEEDAEGEGAARSGCFCIGIGMDIDRDGDDRDPEGDVGIVGMYVLLVDDAIHTLP